MYNPHSGLDALLGRVVQGCSKELRFWFQTPPLAGLVPPMISQFVFCTQSTMSFHFVCRVPLVKQSYIEFMSMLLRNKSRVYVCPHTQKVSDFSAPPPCTVAPCELYHVELLKPSPRLSKMSCVADDEEFTTPCLRCMRWRPTETKEPRLWNSPPAAAYIWDTRAKL